MSKSLGTALAAAVQAGHYPGVYYRGGVWRVHLDVGSNLWEDVQSLEAAATWLRKELRK